MEKKIRTRYDFSVTNAAFDAIADLRERLGSDAAVLSAVAEMLKEYAEWYADWAAENPEAVLRDRYRRRPYNER